MKKDYDFSNGKRGAVLDTPGQTGATIYLDNGILDAFRKQGDSCGRGYQTLINQVLRDYLEKTSKPLEAKTPSEFPATNLHKAG